MSEERRRILDAEIDMLQQIGPTPIVRIAEDGILLSECAEQGMVDLRHIPMCQIRKTLDSAYVMKVLRIAMASYDVARERESTDPAAAIARQMYAEQANVLTRIIQSLYNLSIWNFRASCHTKPSPPSGTGIAREDVNTTISVISMIPVTIPKLGSSPDFNDPTRHPITITI